MAISSTSLLFAFLLAFAAFYSNINSAFAAPRSRPYSFEYFKQPKKALENSRKLRLVATPTPSLTYHGGALLTAPGALRVHLLWYGDFPAEMKSAVSDFISSIFPSKTVGRGISSPSVAAWWRTVRRYTDSANSPAAPRVVLGSSANDAACSIGKNLTSADLSALVQSAVKKHTLPGPPRAGRGTAAYVVLTAADVLVEDFCMNTCGSHASVTSSSLPFIWVGNSATQCPGLCSWPFAIPQYGPPGPALTAPNGQAAIDGMIINLASLLMGTVTNPFGNGYYEGDVSVPEEAGSACEGKYGPGSYPGYPGQLLTDTDSGASYNANGVNRRRFLLPAVWDPATKNCKPLP